MSNRSINSNTPSFWATATIGAGPALTQDAGVDCVLTRTGVGVYVATLPMGGVNSTNGTYTFSFAAAAGGFFRIVDTSDTVKTITVTDSANAALECTKIRFAGWKGA